MTTLNNIRRANRLLREGDHLHAQGKHAQALRKLDEIHELLDAPTKPPRNHTPVPLNLHGNPVTAHVDESGHVAAIHGFDDDLILFAPLSRPVPLDRLPQEDIA